MCRSLHTFSLTVLLPEPAGPVIIHICWTLGAFTDLRAVSDVVAGSCCGDISRPLGFDEEELLPMPFTMTAFAVVVTVATETFSLLLVE